jgi:hypothetical protein
VLAVSVADYVYASRVGKFTVWAELLQSLDLRGDERATPSSRLADRVDHPTGDMRSLPFEDESFDLVSAGLAIHNITEAAGRSTKFVCASAAWPRSSDGASGRASGSVVRGSLHRSFGHASPGE